MVQEEPVPPKEPGLISATASLLIEPSVLGASVARSPLGVRTILALLALVLVTLGCAFLMRPAVEEAMRERMRHDPRMVDMTAEQRARTQEMLASPAIQVATAASQVAFALVGVVAVACLLHLGQSAMGGRATLAQSFTLAAFAGLIALGLSQVLQAVLARNGGSLERVSLGLGLLLDRPAYDPLRALLDLVNVVVLPVAIATGLALAVPARLSRAVAVGVSLVTYLVLMGTSGLFRVLFRS